MAERHLAVVRSYAELHEALRARHAELRVTLESIDAVAGVQSGYAAKLLAPEPLKILGAMSLGPLLMTLGIKLIVVEDLEAVEQITSRLKIRDRAGDAMLAVKPRKGRRYAKLGPAWGKLMRARQLVTTTWVERKRVARNAAKHRWAKTYFGRNDFSPERIAKAKEKT